MCMKHGSRAHIKNIQENTIFLVHFCNIQVIWINQYKSTYYETTGIFHQLFCTVAMYKNALK